MLTIFGTPRTFEGHFGLIQRNAIKSWLQLEPQPQVLIMGTAEGTAEACAELGVTHVPDIEHNEFGTPLVSSMIAKAEELSCHNLMLLLSTDIIIFQDTVDAAMAVSQRFDRFCGVVCKKNADIDYLIDFASPSWAQRIRCVGSGIRQNTVAGDFFLFPKGFWGDFPPFAIGRTIVDNWMFYRTLELRGALIDMTPVVTIVHQSHDYSHHPDGMAGVWRGVEAQRNLSVAGGHNHVFLITDANWVLTKDGIRRPPLTKHRFWRYVDTKSVLHPTFARAFRLVKPVFPFRTIPRRLARQAIGLFAQ